MSRTCGDCVYFKPAGLLSKRGFCRAPIPEWAKSEATARFNLTFGSRHNADLCMAWIERPSE